MNNKNYIDPGIYVALKQFSHILYKISANEPIPYMDQKKQKELKELYDETFKCFNPGWFSMADQFKIYQNVTSYISDLFKIISELSEEIRDKFHALPSVDLDELETLDPVHFSEDLQKLKLHKYMSIYSNIVDPNNHMVVQPSDLGYYIKTIIQSMEITDYDNVGKVYKFKRYNFDDYFATIVGIEQEDALYDIRDALKLIDRAYAGYTEEIMLLVNHIAKIGGIELKEERPQRNNSTGETEVGAIPAVVEGP